MNHRNTKNNAEKSRGGPLRLDPKFCCILHPSAKKIPVQCAHCEATLCGACQLSCDNCGTWKCSLGEVGCACWHNVCPECSLLCCNKDERCAECIVPRGELIAPRNMLLLDESCATQGVCFFCWMFFCPCDHTDESSHSSSESESLSSSTY